MNGPINSLFAAGLFDSPWAVAVIVIVGALVNWLSKRREDKRANQSSASEEPAVPAGKPAGEFNLEEVMRRLMGEETPVTTLAPPPLPRAARGEAPPIAVWREKESFPTAPLAPSLRPPPVAIKRAAVATLTAGERREQAAVRFEQLNEQGRHPATAVNHGRDSRSRQGQRVAARWRDPRNVRQAFVASLIFAPPKGLES